MPQHDVAACMFFNILRIGRGFAKTCPISQGGNLGRQRAKVPRWVSQSCADSEAPVKQSNLSRTCPLDLGKPAHLRVRQGITLSVNARLIRTNPQKPRREHSRLHWHDDGLANSCRFYRGGHGCGISRLLHLPPPRERIPHCILCRQRKLRRYGRRLCVDSWPFDRFDCTKDSDLLTSLPIPEASNRKSARRYVISTLDRRNHLQGRKTILLG